MHELVNLSLDACLYTRSQLSQSLAAQCRRKYREPRLTGLQAVEQKIRWLQKHCDIADNLAGGIIVHISSPQVAALNLKLFSLTSVCGSTTASQGFPRT